MGGIKNKLNNKLSNRTLFKLGSHLVTLTKYLAISCFTLALISTIGLNLYGTYSNDNIETSAIGSSNNSEPATQADIDSTSISLSITSSPSSSTGGNDANLSLSIPQGGGIATGRHTVMVETGSSVIEYDLMLSSDSEETNIVVDGLSDSPDTTITPTWGSPSVAPSQITNNTYGYTTRDVDSDNMLVYANVWYGLPPASKPNTIASVDLPLADNANTTTNNAYWAVRVNNPESMLAGDYARNIVYTVVGELMPEPVISNIEPDVYKATTVNKILVNNNGDLYALVSDGTIKKFNGYTISDYYISGDGITDFATGGYSYAFTLLKTDSNEIRSFGYNNYGQLGNGEVGSSISSDTPANITNAFTAPVIKLYAGADYSAAVTIDNHVYMWGYGGSGNLGTGNSNNQLAPVDITNNFPTINGRIVDMSLADDIRTATTFALTDAGHVYGWGDGRYGALGTGKNQYEYYPVDITDNFNLASGESIIHVATNSGNGSWGYGLALTDKGRVFSWGDGENGTLGNGSTADSYLPKDITTYFQLDNGDKIVAIGAGIQKTFAISANGIVYAWGEDLSSLTPTIISGSDKFLDMNTQGAYIATGFRLGSYLLDGANNIYVVANSSSSKVGQNITSKFTPSPLLTLTGSNFSNVTDVYIDLNRDGAMQANEQCTDLTINSDTELTCNVPTDNNIATGDYTMYVETPYNYTTTTFRYQNYSE